MEFAIEKLILKTAILTCIIGGFFIISVIPSQLAHAQNNVSPNILVFPADSKPYGKPYAEWSAIWWQWLLSIPKDTSPAGDSTGKNCGTTNMGQYGFWPKYLEVQPNALALHHQKRQVCFLS